MKHWVKSIGVCVDGAEEFAYLMNKCLFLYGSVIGKGMYQHVQATSSDEQIQGRDNPETPTSTETGDADQQHNATYQRPSQDNPDDKSTETTTNNFGRSQKGRLIHNKHTSRNTLWDDGHKTPPTSDQPEDAREAYLRQTIDGMRINLEEQDSVLDFSSVAGLEEAKMVLEEFACFFLHFPHLTRKLRQRSTTGILLFGPQGTGKTLIVRSFAQRYGLALYDVRASAIMSKFVGESEKFIRALFSEVRAHAPAIILLDECDGLLCDPAADAMQSHNYRLLQNEIKNQWSDLIQSRDEVIVVGATNKPHDIDMDGFGRRLSLKLLIDLPSAEGCQAVLHEALNRLHHRLEEHDFPVLGFLCHEKGLSGYDIDVLVEAMLRRAIHSITIAQHFARVPWNEGYLVVPCAEDDPGATPGPWTALAAEEPEAISYSPFVFSDVESAVARAKPTVDDAMRQKHAAFAAQYSTH